MSIFNFRKWINAKNRDDNVNQPSLDDHDLQDAAFREATPVTDHELLELFNSGDFYEASDVYINPPESFEDYGVVGARGLATVRANWLVDAALMTGYPVVVERGWATRGVGNFVSLEGVVGHHTGTPADGEYPTRNVILNGRPRLSGPLSQLGLGRSGTIYVVASGTANHAGVSDWAGFTNLNNRFIGIEAESRGVNGDWTPAQLDAYPRLVAALLHYMKKPSSRYASHRSVANPPGRKPDPQNISDEWMRTRVDPMLRNPLLINKKGVTPTPPPAQSFAPSGTVKKIQLALRLVPADGLWGNKTDTALNVIRAAINNSFPKGVKAAQYHVGVAQDGSWGPKSKAALKVTVTELQKALGTPADGGWGPKTESQWKILRARHYNPKVL